METTQPTGVEGIPFRELSLAEQALTAGMFLIAVGFMAFFFYFFFWKMIRAQLVVPKELAGIRSALERIANKLEEK